MTNEPLLRVGSVLVDACAHHAYSSDPIIECLPPYQSLSRGHACRRPRGNPGTSQNDGQGVHMVEG